DRGGAGHRPRHHLHRLPVLPGHAGRRDQRQEELRRGQRVAGDRGRGDPAGPVGHLARPRGDVASTACRRAGPAARARPALRGRLTGSGLTGMDSKRAEAFSDGVFAVAITLLVLELLPIGSGVLTAGVLLHAWPEYFAYAVSFLTIGIMWLNHHTILA